MADLALEALYPGKAVIVMNGIMIAEGDLDQTIHEIASTIAAKFRHTIRIGKGAFYRQLEMALPDAYDYTSEVMVANLESADAAEGICAFLDKRTPRWQDR